MKNIESIIAELGIEVADDKKEALVKMVNENYKTIAEVEKKDAKIQSLTDKVKATEDALKVFDGVDADGMKAQIEALQKSLTDKDNEYAQKLADRDFNELIRDEILKAKGKNVRAITSLLDVDVLKASKNQKEDVANAIKKLTEAEDSSMLFGETAPQGHGANPIGAMGRSSQTSTLDDIYKGNPYYHPKN